MQMVLDDAWLLKTVFDASGQYEKVSILKNLHRAGMLNFKLQNSGFVLARPSLRLFPLIGPI